MVTFGKSETKKAAIEKEFVCPECFISIWGTGVITEIPDPYGRVMRRYFGYCEKCGFGWEVVQFKRDGRWLINKYHAVSRCDGLPFASGCWEILNILPEPAAVVTGPGGDYIKPMEIKTTDVIRRCIDTCRTLANVFTDLLKIQEKNENG